MGYGEKGKSRRKSKAKRELKGRIGGILASPFRQRLSPCSYVNCKTHKNDNRFFPLSPHGSRLLGGIKGSAHDPNDYPRLRIVLELQRILCISQIIA